jgi:DNA-binding transcriptional LysR family regulator
MGSVKDNGRTRAEAWISDMHLFVAVAKGKSFTRAAQQLGIPHSTLSRRVSALETALGLRLLTRTTRHVELTEDGLEYLERAERLVTEAIEIHEELSFRRGKPAGLLRISIPECIALQVSTGWFAEFAALYPDVSLQIDTAPEHVDPIRDGFDICICHTEVKESSYVKRTLASFKWVLFASPDYARQHGLPSTPEELADHQCICRGEGRSATSLWTLYRGSDKRFVEVSGRVTTLSQVLAPELAKEGLGIAAAMPGPFQKDVDDGKLIRVLKDWRLNPMVISIVLPDRLVSARCRAFIEFFATKYRTIIDRYQ